MKVDGELKARMVRMYQTRREEAVEPLDRGNLVV